MFSNIKVCNSISNDYGSNMDSAAKFWRGVKVLHWCYDIPGESAAWAALDLSGI